MCSVTRPATARTALRLRNNDFARGAYLHCGGRVHHPACGRLPSPGGAPRGVLLPPGKFSQARQAAPSPMSDGRRIVDFPDSAWRGKPRRRRRRSHARGVAPKANPRPEARLRGRGADYMARLQEMTDFFFRPLPLRFAYVFAFALCFTLATSLLTSSGSCSVGNSLSCINPSKLVMMCAAVDMAVK